MSDAVLEVAELTATYGRTVAVRGVTFDVKRGEAVALVGPNGAGKTTTLNTIAGLRAPTSGRITLDGKKIGGFPPERLARLGVALIPEGRHIFGRLTVEENLLVAGSVRGFRVVRREFGALFERFPILEERLHQPAAMLSGGQQQQLAFARALLLRPRILLVDEPSFGLSPQVVDKVFDELEALRQDGATILLVEQSTELAVAFADRSYVMRTGRLVLHGTRTELLGNPAVVEASYFGDNGGASQ